MSLFGSLARSTWFGRAADAMSDRAFVIFVRRHLQLISTSDNEPNLHRGAQDFLSMPSASKCVRFILNIAHCCVLKMLCHVVPDFLAGFEVSMHFSFARVLF